MLTENCSTLDRRHLMTQTTTPVLDLTALEDLAVEVRLDILNSTTRAGSGHPSSSFSAVEAVLALYFGGVLALPAGRARLARPRPLHHEQGPRRAAALRRPGPRGLLRPFRTRPAARGRQPGAGPSHPGHDARRGGHHRLVGPGPVGRAGSCARRPPERSATTASTSSWATASARQARSGKPPWPRPTSRPTT